MSETTAVYIIVGVFFTALVVAAVISWIRADRRDEAETAHYQRMRDALTAKGED